MKTLQRNLNRSTFIVWEMKRSKKSQRNTWRTPSFREDWCLVWDVPAAHKWSHLLWRNHHNSCIYGNLQHLCKSNGRWGTLNWIFPAGWTSHTSYANMAEIQSFFGDHVISKRLWPPRSPHLMPPDYFLRGYLKWQFTKTNHEPQTPWKQTSPKKFRQWQRTYWQGFSKIWCTEFNPDWTQMVATSSTCYDVVTFLTQWGKSTSNFVAISLLSVKLLKKYRVR